MAWPSLSEGALALLDMSDTLPVTVTSLTSAVVDRGKRVETWGAPVALVGPYVFDDSPGARRVQDASGDRVEADATLFVGPQGPALAVGALGHGARVTVRGDVYTVVALSDFSETADVRAVGLRGLARP